MNDFEVSTNSLKITHSGEVSRPQDGCKLTGYTESLSEMAFPLSFSFHVYLIVLHRFILAPFTCLVCDLHEIPVHECHPDVCVEGWGNIGYRDKLDLEFLHLSLQLCSDIIGL